MTNLTSKTRMHVLYTHFSLCKIPSSSRPGYGGSQPLSLNLRFLLEETKFPLSFCAYRQGLKHGSCDPVNRVTSISTPSLATNRASPAQIPYNYHAQHLILFSLEPHEKLSRSKM